ncbi:MAG: type II CRISPR-associated endonuclease Cas1 [Bacteroidaceae bacterium]|nr:type II CRISPR-associated endonuclease Cas1 [Bacteroidaceae bacterium]
MLKRTLFFTSPYILSLKNNQMIIKTREMPDMHKSIPVEDIGFVILEHQQTSVTLPLLNALSDNNVAVIICGNNYMPNAMLLSLESNTTQSEVLRMQIEASEPFKKNLWKQIVENKIRNQAALLNKLGKDGNLLKPYYSNVKSGDSDNREGIAAKLYWNELFGKDFIRTREGSNPNNLLNYGYTLLRAAVARALMGSGLLPAIGIFHRNKYNAFPLADDIMEPYRPYVDELVYTLHSQGAEDLTKDVKTEILKILFTDTKFGKITHPLEIGLTTTTASLAKCYNSNTKKILYPQLE